MEIVHIHQAKTQLSKLVEAAAHGEEIIIARDGKVVARLVALAQPQTCIPGALKNKIRIADDFDAPLSADLQATFEGK